MDEENKGVKKEKNSEESSRKVYNQTEDAVLKLMMHYFKDELIQYLGVEGKAIGIAPTEVVHLELKKFLQDFNLIMEDGSWAHFEFQSRDEGVEGLKRFRIYEAVTSYQNQVEVTTYVLFSGMIQNPVTEFTEGVNTYKVKPIIMTRIIVEELVERLQEKIAAGDSITKEDLVPFTLCSLMGGKMSQKDRIKKAFEFSRLAEEHIEREEIKKIEAVMYAMAEKFLDEVDIKEIREAIKMTRLGQMLVDDGREEGREEGRKEGREEGEIKKLIRIVLKKLQRNCDVPEIAEMLEEEEPTIRKIYDIAVSQAPNYEVDKIYQEFIKNKD